MDDSWNPRRDRLAWWGVGVAATAGVGFMLYSFVGAIVVGLFLYYATRPVYRWFADRFEHPDVSASVALLAVGLPMLVVLAYATFVAVGELNQALQADRFEAYRELLGPYLNVASLARPWQLASTVTDNASLIASSAGVLFTWLIRLFVILAVAYYLLRDDDEAAAWFRRTFGDDHGAVAFFEGVDDDLSTVYVGNLITVGITAAIAVVVFYAFNLVAPEGAGVAHPALLGFLVGVFTLLPVVGIKIVYVPYGLYLLARSLTGDVVPLWVPIVFFAVTIVVVDTIPDVFIRSYVSKGELNMGLMLLSYVLGTVAFGWYGLFLGPVLLVLFVRFARHVLPNLVEAGRDRLVTD